MTEVKEVKEERESISVTSLGDCNSKLQLKAIGFPEDPVQYETYRGTVVHKFFEMIIKKNMTWEEFADIQAGLEFKENLDLEMPLFEKKIRDFLTTNQTGKDLLKGKRLLQTELLVRVPIENLGLSLTTPKEVQEKYCLSGKFDMLFGKTIFEIKSGKTETTSHKMQAFTYKILADIIQPSLDHCHRRLYLGNEAAKLVRDSWKTIKGSTTKRESKLKEDLANSIDEAIACREKIKNEPFKKIVPKRNDLGRCQWCNYWTSCTTLPRPQWRKHPLVIDYASKEKDWWQLLDWSTMESVYKKLPEDKQKAITKKGFWSKGVGVFENGTSITV